MKCKCQVKSRASGPLNEIQHLNLSAAGIGSIQGLVTCECLEILCLQYNCITTVFGLDKCRNLWHLDLSNNKLWNLEGLQQFLALGTLILNNNCLTWQELLKLQKIDILDLHLRGNATLDNDNKYRCHVIDTLPKVWALDGHYVMFTERLEVDDFFADSALSDKPVRRKTKKELFVPSSLKNLSVDGIFGHRATRLRLQFPMNQGHNEESDKRRVAFSLYSLQEDLTIEAKYTNTPIDLLENNPNFMDELINLRNIDRVPSNMLLVLLVGSLEFPFPVRLLMKTLEMTQLCSFGTIQTIDLFKLPKEMRLRLVSGLLNHVAVHHEYGEDEGLYQQLYLSLFSCITELHCAMYGGKESRTKYQLHSKSLIASEVVQLMCSVQEFFDYLLKDEDVRSWVLLATGNKPHILEAIFEILTEETEDGADAQNEAMLTLLANILHSTFSLASRQSVWAGLNEYSVLQAKHFEGRHLLPFPLYLAEFHEKGQSPPARKAANVRTGLVERRRYLSKAALGDIVLLGPQMTGRVIAIPEPEILLVQNMEVAGIRGLLEAKHAPAENHFHYLNQDDLEFDGDRKFWRMKGSSGDRITTQQSVVKERVINARSGWVTAASHQEGVSSKTIPPATERSWSREISAAKKSRLPATKPKTAPPRLKFPEGTDRTLSERPSAQSNDDSVSSNPDSTRDTFTIKTGHTHKGRSDAICKRPRPLSSQLSSMTTMFFSSDMEADDERDLCSPASSAASTTPQTNQAMFMIPWSQTSPTRPSSSSSEELVMINPQEIYRPLKRVQQKFIKAVTRMKYERLGSQELQATGEASRTPSSMQTLSQRGDIQKKALSNLYGILNRGKDVIPTINSPERSRIIQTPEHKLNFSSTQSRNKNTPPAALRNQQNQPSWNNVSSWQGAQNDPMAVPHPGAQPNMRLSAHLSAQQSAQHSGQPTLQPSTHMSRVVRALSGVNKIAGAVPSRQTLGDQSVNLPPTQSRYNTPSSFASNQPKNQSHSRSGLFADVSKLSTAVSHNKSIVRNFVPEDIDQNQRNITTASFQSTGKYKAPPGTRRQARHQHYIEQRLDDHAMLCGNCLGRPTSAPVYLVLKTQDQDQIVVQKQGAGTPRGSSTPLPSGHHSVFINSDDLLQVLPITPRQEGEARQAGRPSTAAPALQTRVESCASLSSFHPASLASDEQDLLSDF